MNRCFKCGIGFVCFFRYSGVGNGRRRNAGELTPFTPCLSVNTNIENPLATTVRAKKVDIKNNKEMGCSKFVVAREVILKRVCIE